MHPVRTATTRKHAHARSVCRYDPSPVRVGMPPELGSAYCKPDELLFWLYLLVSHQQVGIPSLLTDRRKAIIVQYEDVHNIIYSFKIRYDIRNQREI